MASYFTFMKIIINNIPWKIKVIPASSEDLRRYNGTMTIGMTDANTNTIYISKDLKGQIIYDVLCHELVHAYCFSYNIFMDIEDEEHMAQFISEFGKEIVGSTEQIIGNMVKYGF